MNNITICQDDDIWKLFDNNDNEKKNHYHQKILYVFFVNLFF